MNSEMAYSHSFKRQSCKLMSFKDDARLNQRYFAPVYDYAENVDLN